MDQKTQAIINQGFFILLRIAEGKNNQEIVKEILTILPNESFLLLDEKIDRLRELHAKKSEG